MSGTVTTARDVVSRTLEEWDGRQVTVIVGTKSGIPLLSADVTLRGTRPYGGAYTVAAFDGVADGTNPYARGLFINDIQFRRASRDGNTLRIEHDNAVATVLLMDDDLKAHYPPLAAA